MTTPLTADYGPRARLGIATPQAIRLALEALGVRSIALVSPYPQGLSEAGYRYWEDAGVRVVAPELAPASPMGLLGD